MCNRAYTIIAVEDEIYCSSSADHFVSVHYRHNGKDKQRDYHFEQSVLVNDTGDEMTTPRYVISEIQRQLLPILKDGSARVYEYDQDGVKRWQALRYHDPKWVSYTNKGFEKHETAAP